MLTIIVPAQEDQKDTELYDEINNEFIVIKGRKGLKKDQTLQLEHSLISLSKWESKWHKPFLTKDERPLDEIIDYIKCMTLTKNVDDHVFECLTQENYKLINDYIGDTMTATTFGKRHEKRNNEIITNEVIYYWMVTLNIPFECERWHLNRLLTLIRVCNVKNEPPKKYSQRETINHYAALNKARNEARKARG